jgi:hypothetical protein
LEHGFRHDKFEGAGNMQKWLCEEARRASRTWRQAALGAIVAAGFFALMAAG